MVFIMLSENKEPKEIHRIILKLKLDGNRKISIPTRIGMFKPYEKVKVTIETLPEE